MAEASWAKPKRLVFFFQAEDGIRDYKVTGVQTCALPILPQSVATALKANGVTPADVKLLVPHQANLRILEMVQQAIGLRDDQIYVNIQKYGNTTAASIPIALHEALCEGRLKRGDLVIMTAFGSGFTWASAAIRW